MRHSLGVIAAFGLALTACDYKYEGPTAYTPASPPGSTAAWGSVSVLVDGDLLTAALPTAATWRNDVFSFAAMNAAGKSKTFALSVRIPGPGTYAIGAPGSPTVSFLESDDATTYRWFASSARGAGSVTVSYVTSEFAGGNFSVELLPDSATAAAGFTQRRFLTGGTFSVSVSR